MINGSKCRLIVAATSPVVGMDEPFCIYRDAGVVLAHKGSAQPQARKLSPGVIGTLPELHMKGFSYAK